MSSVKMDLEVPAASNVIILFRMCQCKKIGEVNRIMDYKRLEKALFHSKTLDALQFFNSVQNYLFYAEIHKEAYSRIIETELKAYREWCEELTMEGAINHFPTGKVSYFGKELTCDMALNIIARSYFQSLHNSIDSYAQFINRALLGEQAIGISDLSPQELVRRLRKESRLYPHISNVVAKLLDISVCDEYKYLTAFNNVMKHHHVIDLDSMLYINDGEYTVKIKGFNYEDEHYQARTLEEALVNSWEMINNFIVECTEIIIDILNNYPHPYTQNRYHELEFGTELYEKNGIRQTVYIQYLTVDNRDIHNQSFQILSAIQYDDKISIKNSPSDVIVLRDRDKNEISILKAVTNMSDKDDIEIIKYRQYVVDNSKDFRIAFFEDVLNNPQKILMTNGEIKFFQK